MISNEKIGKILREAKAEEANNYEQSVIKSVLAIYEVKWLIRSKFRGKPMLYSPMPLGGVEAMLDFIFDIALSGPFAYKLWKLRDNTGIVFLQNGEPTMQKTKERGFTREDATFALGLATEYALWAEQVYG